MPTVVALAPAAFWGGHSFLVLSSPPVGSGDPSPFCHTCVFVAGIHLKKIPDRFPLTSSGNDSDVDRFLIQKSFNGKGRHTKRKDRKRQQLPEQLHL
jgi:hypothetical protein